MMSYTNQPAPAYDATMASDSMLPPPPPFESVSSHGDLMAMDSGSWMGDATGYATPAYPGTPIKAQNGQSQGPNLDLSKFKTKLCRHYSMGRQCPFEARCAFAHGLEEQSEARAAAQAMAPAPPAYDAAFGSSGPSSDVESDSGIVTAPVNESRSSTPPAYPTRYRFDPYNIHSGVVYAN